MKQANDLFGTRATCTGMEIYVDLNLIDEGVHGKLSIHPKWSKSRSELGDVYLVIDEHQVDVVPELLREAWDGLHSADPGYYIPRWVNKHLDDYNKATHKHLKKH